MMRMMSIALAVLALGLIAALPVAALPEAAASTCLSTPASAHAETLDLALLLGLPADDGAEATSSRCLQCANGAACCSSNATCVTWCQARGAETGACWRRCCICAIDMGSTGAPLAP